MNTLLNMCKSYMTAILTSATKNINLSHAIAQYTVTPHAERKCYILK